MSWRRWHELPALTSTNRASQSSSAGLTWSLACKHCCSTARATGSLSFSDMSAQPWNEFEKCTTSPKSKKINMSPSKEKKQTFEVLFTHEHEGGNILPCWRPRDVRQGVQSCALVLQIVSCILYNLFLKNVFLNNDYYFLSNRKTTDKTTIKHWCHGICFTFFAHCIRILHSLDASQPQAKQQPNPQTWLSSHTVVWLISSGCLSTVDRGWTWNTGQCVLRRPSEARWDDDLTVAEYATVYFG